MKSSQVKNPTDLVGGLLVLSMGLIVVVYATRYEIGSFANMGPGAFPLLLGVVLCLLGLIISASALRHQGPSVSIDQGGAVWVIVSIVLFSLTLETLGLIFATAASVLVALIPSGLRYKTRIWLVCLIGIIVYLVFLVGLKINVMPWPWSN